jgi:putative transposase
MLERHCPAAGFIAMTPRHRRNFNEPGHAHELTFSCYQRFPFLKSERTCAWLADSIGAARKSLNFDLWAYVFMPEHVHLIVRPRQTVYDKASIRQAIKAPVARLAIEFLKDTDSPWLEKVTRIRAGKCERLFWQSGGGFDRNITEPATLLRMIEYLHRNPVRRDLAKRAREWKWSSAAEFEGETSPLKIDPIDPAWADAT